MTEPAPLFDRTGYTVAPRTTTVWVVTRDSDGTGLGVWDTESYADQAIAQDREALAAAPPPEEPQVQGPPPEPTPEPTPEPEPEPAPEEPTPEEPAP